MKINKFKSLLCKIGFHHWIFIRGTGYYYSDEVCFRCNKTRLRYEKYINNSTIKNRFKMEQYEKLITDGKIHE